MSSLLRKRTIRQVERSLREASGKEAQHQHRRLEGPNVHPVLRIITLSLSTRTPSVVFFHSCRWCSVSVILVVFQLQNWMLQRDRPIETIFLRAFESIGKLMPVTGNIILVQSCTTITQANNNIKLYSLKLSRLKIPKHKRPHPKAVLQYQHLHQCSHLSRGSV